MLEATLQDYLRRQFPQAKAVTTRDFRIVAGGYSRETFAADVAIEHRNGSSEQLRLILRRDPPDLTAILRSSRLAEHNLLNRIAGNTSIPVPRSLFLDEGGTFFERPAMLIERLTGKSDLSALFGGADADQLESVATDLCEKLAELHMTAIDRLDPDGDYRDPRGIGSDTSSWDAYMRSQLGYFRSNYVNIAFDPLPVFYDGYCTLQNHLPAPVPLVLCHGDFQPSNFLYENGKITGIIDWELTHIGDPREDIGWFAQMQIMTGIDIMSAVKVDGGFLGHYTRLTGIPVTPEDVRFFQLFMSSSIGAPIVAAVKRRLEGEHSEFLHVYMLQPIVASAAVFAAVLGYPQAEGVA